MKITTTLVFFLALFSLLNAQSVPVANEDFFETPQNTLLAVNSTDGVLSNDISNSNNDLSVISFTANNIIVPAGQVLSIPQGDLQMNADGSFTFTPNISFIGNFPNVSYSVSNQDGNSMGSLVLFVANNDPPSANIDYDTAEINTPLIVNAPGVLVNDDDFENNPIEVTAFEVRGNSFLVGETATFREGSINIQADGSFNFKPVAGFTGEVPPIDYTISDGLSTDSATLFLTTERITNLIRYEDVGTCNQGFGKDGNYHIIYGLEFGNESTARDYHPTNLIRQINPTIDLDGVFGTGCVVSVDNVFVDTEVVEDFINDPYPLEFSSGNINPDFLTGSSDQIFTTGSVQNATLYPRQSVRVSFCVTVNPFCDGRPNPTPSGSGIDFNAVFNIDSSIGSSTASLELRDFHTTESQIVASLEIPEISPDVNPDGTYDYINTVVFTNEGSQNASNVNFNMGLGGFLDNGIVFNTLRISQVSGPPVTVNQSYNGDTNTLLLAPNNSIGPGESVAIEIFHIIGAIGSTDDNFFSQLVVSQSQGSIDGLDESTAGFRKDFSFALWEDSLGRHVDRYYNASSLGQISIDEQCACSIASMSFSASSSNAVSKIINTTEVRPNGILEHQAITFDIQVRNTSAILDLDNLQIFENLQNICGSNIVSFDAPVILSSNATINPTLNSNFDGVTDTRIFNTNTGLLGSNQNITVRIRVVFNENCFGVNTVEFRGTDPLNIVNSTTASVDVVAFTDTDNDGISNFNDIDDDNDGIPDVIESNGINPIADDDNDFIPNYRDLNFGGDFNNDGIVDVFDFDGDGVPNHFDLDADNDGIFDITEAGNTFLDSNNDGMTDGSVGSNGLDDSLEFDDSISTSINYSITNTDADSLADYNDIDSDADGIVDNIESQPTNNYISPNNLFNDFGVDTAYTNGIQPVDSDNDTLFDYVDVNSDNDIRDDIIEGWDTDSDGVPEITNSGNDIDNDGLDDAFDNDMVIINPNNSQNPFDFPNSDYQVTPERDWRELMAIVVIISNRSVVEGDTANFNISLVTFNDSSIPVESITPITINFNTQDGGFNLVDEFSTATSPFDYDPVINNAITIPPFTSSASLSVNTLNDNIFEQEEFFALNAEIISNNTITTDVLATGTILDDELPPTFNFEDSIANEGQDLNYEIVLSHPASTPINFSITTINGTALAIEDFEAINTQATIQGTIDPGLPNLSSTFSATTLLDNLNETEEELLSVSVRANTTNVSNQSLVKLGTIIDVDPDPFVVITGDTVTEGNPLTFTISLLNEQNNEPMRNYEALVIDLFTQDVTTGILDYTSLTQSIEIPALATQVTQIIETNDDNLNEDTEQLNLIGNIRSVAVSNVLNEVIGIGIVKDNDIPNLFSPNNDGLSDKFRIAGLEDFPNFKLQIMDRWGGKVYDYKNNGSLDVLWWDGNNNGRSVAEGVYYYALDFNDGITPIKMGFVQLVR